MSYGNWRDDTPARESRLRQIQRWRTGFRSAGAVPKAKAQFTILWPMGEKQRQEAEPTFTARPASRRASHRLFLRNCSTEIVREVRAKIDGVEVAYEPALQGLGFAELHWTRNPSIRSTLFGAANDRTFHLPLDVEFAVANGTRRAFLRGELRLHANDGWVAFRAQDRTEKEIE